MVAQNDDILHVATDLAEQRSVLPATELYRLATLEETQASPHLLAQVTALLDQAIEGTTLPASCAAGGEPRPEEGRGETVVDVSVPGDSAVSEPPGPLAKFVESPLVKPRSPAPKSPLLRSPGAKLPKSAQLRSGTRNKALTQSAGPAISRIYDLALNSPSLNSPLLAAPGSHGGSAARLDMAVTAVAAPSSPSPGVSPAGATSQLAVSALDVSALNLHSDSSSQGSRSGSHSGSRERSSCSDKSDRSDSWSGGRSGPERQAEPPVSSDSESGTGEAGEARGVLETAQPDQDESPTSIQLELVSEKAEESPESPGGIVAPGAPGDIAQGGAEAAAIAEEAIAAGSLAAAAATAAGVADANAGLESSSGAAASNVLLVGGEGVASREAASSSPLSPGKARSLSPAQRPVQEADLNLTDIASKAAEGTPVAPGIASPVKSGRGEPDLGVYVIDPDVLDSLLRSSTSTLSYLSMSKVQESSLEGADQARSAVGLKSPPGAPVTDEEFAARYARRALGIDGDQLKEMHAAAEAVPDLRNKFYLVHPNPADLVSCCKHCFDPRKCNSLRKFYDFSKDVCPICMERTRFELAALDWLEEAYPEGITLQDAFDCDDLGPELAERAAKLLSDNAAAFEYSGESFMQFAALTQYGDKDKFTDGTAARVAAVKACLAKSRESGAADAVVSGQRGPADAAGSTDVLDPLDPSRPPEISAGPKPQSLAGARLFTFAEFVCEAVFGVPGFFAFTLFPRIRAEYRHLHPLYASQHALFPSAQVTRDQVKLDYKAESGPNLYHFMITPGSVPSAGPQEETAECPALKVTVKQLRMFHNDYVVGRASLARAFACLALPKASVVVKDDILAFMAGICRYHPGLEFLRATPEFQVQYALTVAARVFYTMDRTFKDLITQGGMEQQNFIQVLWALQRESDINKILKYFSYEHFYVIFCKFWELDEDHDQLLSREDLCRYGANICPYAFICLGAEGNCPSNGQAQYGRRRTGQKRCTCSNVYNRLAVDRIFAGVPRPIKCQVPDRIGYEDFIPFLLSEEDKDTDTALDYFFAILDVDGDGFVTASDLLYFAPEMALIYRKHRRDVFRSQDLFCQVTDMCKHTQHCVGEGFAHRDERISKRDIRRCKTPANIFNVFLHFTKAIQFECKDPYTIRYNPLMREKTSWDRYARRMYDTLEGMDDAGDVGDSGDVYDQAGPELEVDADLGAEADSREAEKAGKAGGEGGDGLEGASGVANETAKEAANAGSSGPTDSPGAIPEDSASAAAVGEPAGGAASANANAPADPANSLNPPVLADSAGSDRSPDSAAPAGDAARAEEEAAQQ